MKTEKTKKIARLTRTLLTMCVRVYSGEFTATTVARGEGGGERRKRLAAAAFRTPKGPQTTMSKVEKKSLQINSQRCLRGLAGVNTCAHVSECAMASTTAIQASFVDAFFFLPPCFSVLVKRTTSTSCTSCVCVCAWAPKGRRNARRGRGRDTPRHKAREGGGGDGGAGVRRCCVVLRWHSYTWLLSSCSLFVGRSR